MRREERGERECLGEALGGVLYPGNEASGPGEERESGPPLSRVLHFNVTAAVIIGNGSDYKNDTANAILPQFATLMSPHYLPKRGLLKVKLKHIAENHLSCCHGIYDQTSPWSHKHTHTHTHTPTQTQNKTE